MVSHLMRYSGGATMDKAEVDALFAQTLRGEYDGEDAWAAVSALRQAGDREIFEHAAVWCLWTTR